MRPGCVTRDTSMPTDPSRDTVFPSTSFVYNMWRRDKYLFDAMTCFIPTPLAPPPPSSLIVTFSRRAAPDASLSMLALTTRPTFFVMSCSRNTPRFARDGRMVSRSPDVKSWSRGWVPDAMYSAVVRAPSYTQPVIITILDCIHVVCLHPPPDIESYIS